MISLRSFNLLCLGVALGITASALVLRRPPPAAAAKKPPTPARPQFGSSTMSAKSSSSGQPRPDDATAKRPLGHAEVAAALAARDLTEVDPRLAATVKNGRLKIEREYTPLFLEMGLAPEMIGRLKEDLNELMSIKVQMLNLADVYARRRHDFRRESQQLLGEHHDDYMNWEAESQGRREYATIERFVSAAGGTLDANEREGIIRVLTQTAAYSPGTVRTMEGVHPFEETPLPYWGTFAEGLRHLEPQLAEAKRSGPAAVAAATAAGLSTETIASLQRYFVALESHLAGQVADARNPFRLSLRNATRELETLRLTEPADSPRIIAAENQVRQIQRVVDQKEADLTAAAMPPVPAE